MAKPILNTPRVLRTGNPLTLAQIRGVAPSVFAEQAHSSRGPRYAYVPTIRPLETLLEAGWGVWEASQQRSRDSERDPYTKHMLRVRKLEDFQPKEHEDGVPEVVILNAHDGTAAYNVFAGFFKFLCSNGLIVGKGIAGFKVRHTVGPTTSQEVLEASEKTVTQKFPMMLSSIQLMKDTMLSGEAQMELAVTAARLRYGSVNPPFGPEELLKVRRDADLKHDAWTVMNRIQENIIEGGWEVRSAMFGRKSMVRGVERVTAVANINAGLWDKTIELC